MLKGINFGRHASRFVADGLTGNGFIEVRLDSVDAETVARIDAATSDECSARLSGRVRGVHDVYILFSAADMTLHGWHVE